MDYYHEIKLGFLNRQNADLDEFLPQSVAQGVKASLVCIKQNCELTNVCKDALKFGFEQSHALTRIERAPKGTLGKHGLRCLGDGILAWTKGRE